MKFYEPMLGMLIFYAALMLIVGGVAHEVKQERAQVEMILCD